MTITITGRITQTGKSIAAPIIPSPTLGETGLFTAGGSSINTIDWILISTAGNATYFGGLTSLVTIHGSASDGANDRGLSAGGWTGANSNIIDYVTITSMGDASDFGDLSIARYYPMGDSNGIDGRAVFASGIGGGHTNIMEYVTISSLGHAGEFGQLNVSRYACDSTSNATNDTVIWGAGRTDGTTVISTVESKVITTLGNASYSGSISVARHSPFALSNGTNERAVFGGGWSPGSGHLIDMRYRNVVSGGGASLFGNLSTATRYLGGTSNGTNERGVFAGGDTYGNIIEYITISSTSSSTDFGDLTLSRSGTGALSNA